MTLSWDNIHEQSREQLCLVCGLRVEVARRKWNDLEEWLQEILRSNKYGIGLQ